MEADQAELRFKQDALLTPLRIFWPDLTERLFNPDYLPEAEEAPATQGVLFPTSDEEFDQMVAEWELDAIKTAVGISVDLGWA